MCLPTFSVGHHPRGLPVVRGDGTPGPAVAPLAAPALVVARLVHLRGAPGLVLRQVGGDPGALGVHHAIELEGEDTGLVC